MSDHVFFCYVREDEQFVLQLAGNLRVKGVPIWLDQWNIPPGADWDRSIDDAIYNCADFIIILSPQALESTEVRGELRTALDEKKHIIPVIRYACRVPRQLRTIQYIDFSSRDPDDQAALTRLLRTLRASTDMEELQRVETNVKLPEEAKLTVTEAVTKKEEDVRQAKEETTGERRKRPGKIFRDVLKDGSQGPQMVVVPAGEFKMGDVCGDGDVEERPVHSVRISKAFAIGRYPITFEEYDRFATATSRELPDDLAWGRGGQPVINVAWADAVECANWLSEQTGKHYRLPTEAEWEYAARAGSETAYWWGTEIKSGMANCADDGSRWGRKQTAPVGSFPPNPFGLYDTAGNVWEWVQDHWHENYAGAPIDGSAWEDKTSGKRVIRGGSWNVSPRNLRSSNRSRGNPGFRGNVVGFRLAQDLS
jgi:formylglycine-generating enzyme required for sulfatase activity